MKHVTKIGQKFSFQGKELTVKAFFGKSGIHWNNQKISSFDPSQTKKMAKPI